MKPITVFVTVLICLLTGCSKNTTNINDIKARDDAIKKYYRWAEGQEVELVGVIWPSKSPAAKFHIRCSDNRNPQLISDKINKLNLKRGTAIWVKGNIEYIQYNIPKSDMNSSPFSSQPICCLRVKDFKIMEDSNQATQQTQQTQQIQQAR